MSIEDDALFYNEIETYITQYFNEIKDIVKDSFREAIKETVYDYYSPIQYQRTEQMINNIQVHLNKDNELYVYVDNQMYYSAVDGNQQDPNFINYIIEHGHDDGIGIQQKGYNQYHIYEGRHYLERAKELIDERLNCNCEIISDEP